MADWFSGSIEGKRVVYVCDWLPPDFGAVGQYSVQFSRGRAEAAQDVLLVGLSSTQSSIHVETCGKGRLTTWKLRSASYDKTSFASRLRWTAIINLRLMWHLFRPFMRADEIVFTGSPPFMVHWIAPLNMLLRKQVIYRITDFYPECLMAARQRVGLPLRLLRWVTVFWRKRIPVIEILGEDQRRRLHEVGISNDRIQLNRDPSPITIPAGTTPMQVPPQIAGYTILLYSGNYGVAHDHETFVDGYIRHHREGTGKVALWLNAVGAHADIVEQRLREANVPFHRSSPVTLERLPNLLVTPDAHLITLKDSFVGYVMPSKVYGCIESGRQIVYIGSRQSDVHLLCDGALSNADYHRIDVGDVDGIRTVLDALPAANQANFESVI